MLLDHHDVNVSLPWAKLLYKDEDKCKSKFIQTKIRLDDYCPIVFIFLSVSYRTNDNSKPHHCLNVPFLDIIRIKDLPAYKHISFILTEHNE